MSMTDLLLAVAGNTVLAVRRAGALCVARALRRRLGHAGPGVEIGGQVRLYGPEHIRVGAGTVIGHGVVLRALTAYPWSDPPQTFTPDLRIGSGVFIGSGTHISCAARITIEDEVMIADGGFIADNTHGYADPALNIKRQPLPPPEAIHIGEGAWIGAGACLRAGIRIGRHSVIGARAVVTRDIPEFCVAAGAPARVVKRYDPRDGRWRPTGPDGEWRDAPTETGDGS